MECKELRTEDI